MAMMSAHRIAKRSRGFVASIMISALMLLSGELCGKLGDDGMR
jgi:hypothetical protein